jgi:predicted Rossmann fold nucleotide-binding protein DprA/Smf involved in DNA uptake
MEINNNSMSLDTKAILLLFGTFGKEHSNDMKSLSITEYNEVAQWLHSNQLRPADLFQVEVINQFRDYKKRGLSKDRVSKLMSRGATMAFALEKWTNSGLWVLSRSDSHYPEILRKRLGKLASPLLYGAGDKQILSKGGLAVIGSRDVDQNALQFTREITKACVKEGIQIISGGAKGVDREAMITALQEGGSVIGVLSNNLNKEAVSGKYRDSLREGHLVLVSPYFPGARFTVGNAMGRNKYIYALSNWALVISSALGNGGTWAGATENLRKKWTPLFVRNNEKAPEGNKRLLAMGGIGIDENWINDGLPIGAWLEMTSSRSYTALKKEQRFPFPSAIGEPDEPGYEEVEYEKRKELPEGIKGQDVDIFNIVWPIIDNALKEPLNEKELAKKLDILPSQARAWLKRALEEKKVAKLKRPARYISSQKNLFEGKK